ncbi:MAG TPA: CPBP family intramembrane glutamic endopeptidase, partial [Longilinea sp.]|nr:CPBP family intramembrane glutamic endopeptidase [Longilinea sp.]
LRSLQSYSLILVVLFTAEWASGLLAGTALWQSWFGGSSAGFTQSMLSTQLLRLGVAVVMVGVLLVLFKKPKNIFFVRGDLQAVAQPIPLLMDKPNSWKKLGWILAVCITGGTLVFLFLGGLPTNIPITSILALFPFVLLFAAINAFAEEMNYRAGLLAALEEPLGGKQALLITALFFGIGHFYGVPYGIVGVIMASLLGWLLGKSMLETRGFCWAWFIHFLQDVAIFTFIGIGSIIPGG